MNLLTGNIDQKKEYFSSIMIEKYSVSISKFVDAESSLMFLHWDPETIKFEWLRHFSFLLST